MPFVPDSGFGLAYLMALCTASYLARKGSWQIIAIMWLHWGSMRTIDVIDRDNLFLWMVQDVAMIVAFLSLAKSRVWYGMACAFFMGLVCDQISMIAGAVFEAQAAMGEFIGYLAMVTMVGGAGHGIRLLGPISGVFRHASSVFHVEEGRSISPSTGMSGQHISAGQNFATENGKVK